MSGKGFWPFIAIVSAGIISFGIGYEKGHRVGGAHMRDAILCAIARTSGEAMKTEAQEVCSRISSPVAVPSEGFDHG